MGGRPIIKRANTHRAVFERVFDPHFGNGDVFLGVLKLGDHFPDVIEKSLPRRK